MAPVHNDYSLSQLDSLEAESIHIIREVAAEFERPVLLFSGGKDSIVMLALAEKAFWPARIPFPVMHVDTGHNFPEVLEFRDRRVAEAGVQLIVASVQESIDAGRVVEETGRWASRNRLQTTTLLDAIAGHQFDAVFGGARRDEEKARAKERVFSFRDEFGQWDPEEPAPGAVGHLQHPDPPGRAHPGVPAVQLDRAGRLGVHRTGEPGDPVHLLRAHAQRVRARRNPARRRPLHHPGETTSRCSAPRSGTGRWAT